MSSSHGEPQLGALLKECRRRIDLESRSLGRHLRMPARVGRPVTQEEVAEAVGISRVWYAMMESARHLRVSGRTLAAIAEVLMMNAEEQATLFRLALPELGPASLSDHSTEVLSAFGSLRSFTRRLWAATTETEALASVREYASKLLAPKDMQTLTRVGEGNWIRVTTADPGRAIRYHAMVQERWGCPFVDDLCCYTSMPNPGDLITREERDAQFPELAAKERPTLEAVNRGSLSFAMATIRSRRGFAARLLAVHYDPHDFSEVERAQLSTLADVTSLALSGLART